MISHICRGHTSIKHKTVMHIFYGKAIFLSKTNDWQVNFVQGKCNLQPCLNCSYDPAVVLCNGFYGCSCLGDARGNHMVKQNLASAILPFLSLYLHHIVKIYLPNYGSFWYQ